MTTRSGSDKSDEKSSQNSLRGAPDPISRAPLARLRRFLKRFGPFLFLAAFSVGIVALLRWINDDGPQTKSKQAQVSPLQIENLSSFIVRKDGHKLWEIAAQKVALSSKADQTIAENVSKATFFRDGKPLLNLTAPRVRLANNTNNLEATGGVFASGPDKFSFRTPLVRWLNQKKLVQCPQRVTATLREFEFDAPNLTYLWDAGEVICNNAVEMRTKGAVLRSNMLKANLKSREIELGGGVELIFDPKTANLQQQLAPSTQG